jgi:hypothetical protein
MELLDTVTNAVLLILVGGLISWQLSGRFKALDGVFKAIDRRFNAIDGRFTALEARMDSLQRSVDGMRSDLTRIALAVGTTPQRDAGA